MANQLGVSEVSWSPDGQVFAAASDDKSVILWSLKQVLEQGLGSAPWKRLNGHTSYVYCCAFSPNGLLLASGGFDDALRVWDLRKGTPFMEIAAHGDPITSVSFSDDSSMILTSSYDGLIRLWDAENGRCLRTLVDNDNPPVAWASFTPNSRYILVATLDSTIRLWCPTTGKCIRTFTAPGFSLKKYSCAAKLYRSESAILLFAGSEDGSIYCWNLDTKQLLSTTTVAPSQPILALDIDQTNSKLVCSALTGESSKIYIFSIDK